MVRQRLPALSAHLAGARLDRQERLSVPHHPRAYGRVEVASVAAPALRLGERRGMPSESTFSRAFAEFAEDQLPQQIHEQIVTTHAGTKLVGHVSRDATALRHTTDGGQTGSGRPGGPAQTGPAQARRSPSAGAVQTPGTSADTHLGRESGGLAQPL